MKYLFLFIFLSLLIPCAAQLTIKSIDLQAGATLMDWDGLYNNSPGDYTRRWGHFAGLDLKIGRYLDKKGYLRGSINYRKTHTDRTTNMERIKLDELALRLGLGQNWKKISFGLNGSFMYIITKEKFSNTPLAGVDLNNVEDFYLSLSGNISFGISNRISLLIEQVFLSTEVYHTYINQRGERFKYPYNPSWTLLGLSYTISKRE